VRVIPTINTGYRHGFTIAGGQHPDTHKNALLAVANGYAEARYDNTKGVKNVMLKATAATLGVAGIATGAAYYVGGDYKRFTLNAGSGNEGTRWLVDMDITYMATGVVNKFGFATVGTEYGEYYYDIMHRITQNPPTGTGNVIVAGGNIEDQTNSTGWAEDLISLAASKSIDIILQDKLGPVTTVIDTALLIADVVDCEAVARYGEYTVHYEDVPITAGEDYFATLLLSAGVRARAIGVGVDTETRMKFSDKHRIFCSYNASDEGLKVKGINIINAEPAP